MNKAAGQAETASRSEGSEPGLVPFRIFRSDQALARQEPSEPLLHKNTLAQMLYEAFHRKQDELGELIPGVILFRDGMVEGLPGPGVYIPDFHKDAFRLTDRMNVRQIRKHLGTSGLKSSLAVGYFQRNILMEKEIGKLRAMSIDLAQELGSILSLHGNLTDFPETVSEIPDLPLLSIQWIAEAKN